MQHRKGRTAAHPTEESESEARAVTELPLTTCYVSVGGYGTVEIRALHDRATDAKSVRLALPCRSDAPGEGECVLQPNDTIAIHAAHGEIARIPVQQVIDQQSYAGFRMLVGDTFEPSSESSQDDALHAFEQYLAGVSARALRDKEREERTSQ